MGPEGTGRPAGISAQNVPLVTVTGHRDRDRDRDGIFILLIVARPFAHTGFSADHPPPPPATHGASHTTYCMVPI